MIKCSDTDMAQKQFPGSRQRSKTQIPAGKKSDQPQTPPASPGGAIISPSVDFLCCGGLSIFVVIGIFGYAHFFPQSQFMTQGLPLVGGLILGTFINAPHFMASYFLLYRNRVQITQHKAASTYVPLILLAAIVYAFLTPTPGASNPHINATVVDFLTVVSAILLAWHYTGQAWGMTGSFAYIRGIRMEQLERWLIRSGYYMLLVWHILWACLFMLRNPESIFAKNFVDQLSRVQFAFNVWSGLVLLTIPLGIAGFIRIRRRTGVMPPLRCYAPWIAIYLWYVLIWAHPSLFALLQIFHALQYLVFPLRVEVNQYSARQKRSGGRQLLHGLGYYVLLVIVGLAVFELPTLPLMWGDGKMNFLVATCLNLLAVTTAFVNIHHYFIDGAIWKIRNPEVRRVLFAHLKTA